MESTWVAGLARIGESSYMQAKKTKPKLAVNLGGIAMPNPVMVASGTVSYTHLTLPTIYSV